MRRGINIRKKKKLAMKSINEKCLKIIGILILLLSICCLIYYFYIQIFFIKNNFEQYNINLANFNENIPFSLNKIILFSSATAQTNTVNQTLSLDISQYCDIGIYIDNTDKYNKIIDSLYIDNISISNPEIGTPYLYKKQITDLGKNSFSEDAIITDNFHFNIVPNNSEIDYTNYEIFNNCSTPVTLGFFNKNIKENFISDLEEFSYNGTLLKKALISQTSLACSISFRINIITTTQEHYICNVNFIIPFEDEKGNLYDTGYVIKEYNKNETNKFIRIK